MIEFSAVSEIIESQEPADTCDFSRRWNLKQVQKMALLRINDRTFGGDKQYE